MEDSTLQKKMRRAVMTRIYFIYVLRLLKSPLALKIEGIALVAVALSYLVSIPDIILNMETVGFAKWAEFMYAALTSTEFTVQILLALAAGVVAFIVHDIVSKREQFELQTQTI